VSLISPVTPSITITASTNYVFPGTKITFTADVKNGSGADTYQWYVNGATAGNNSAKFESSELADGDLVMCVILANNVCSLPAESPAIKVNLVSRIEIPNTFTPNADGINDTWFIKGLASYPDCLVCIYNRQGQLLYRSKGYSAQWDGRLNGKDVPPSTYYYVIDLHFKNKVMSGYVTLIK
jgi:gliding motility-associated-like protein